MLSGRRILVGVSGSIAAYKVPDVIRRLRDQGAEVRVVMTRNAARFVTPLTFEAISGHPVLCDEFTAGATGPMGHISATAGLDCALIAPATANIIGKIAAGIADDALSTALMAATCPLVIAPAMNDRMYRNAVLQRNIGALRDAGMRFVEPELGSLACGETGQGRLASTDRIVRAVTEALSIDQSLSGEQVLVTAGPTREPIDAVRFISNPSSGRMGFAVAAAARDRGAAVTLVAGPAVLVPPAGVHTVHVSTAAEMHQAVKERAAASTIIIMAAAVSDFRPAQPQARKVKKDHAETTVLLERTEDILLELGAHKGKRLLVGFAAESDDLAGNARAKLEQKNLDLVVANDITSPDAGFGSLTNRATLIDRNGTVMELPLLSKEELAERIIDKIAELKVKSGL